jgi:hypothetical protein
MKVEAYITIRDAAALSGKTEETIRNAVYRERLKQYEVLGSKVLKRVEFDTWRANVARGRPRKKTKARPGER